MGKSGVQAEKTLWKSSQRILIVDCRFFLIIDLNRSLVVLLGISSLYLDNRPKSESCGTSGYIISLS